MWQGWFSKTRWTKHYKLDPASLLPQKPIQTQCIWIQWCMRGPVISPPFTKRQQKHAHLLQTLFQQLQITTTPPSHTHRFRRRPFSDSPLSIKSNSWALQRTCISMHEPHFRPPITMKKEENLLSSNTFTRTEEGWQKIKHGLLCLVLGHLLWESAQFCIESLPCFPACHQLIGPLLWQAKFYHN